MGNNSSKWIGILVMWCVLLAFGLAVIFKYVFKPHQDKKLEQMTSAVSQYEHEVTVNLDSFSGYSILRSDVFKEELKAAKIRVAFQDDGADYHNRIRALEEGACQFAVFTVDSLITSSVELGSWPGTIVLAIDESHGADAVIAYKASMPNLNSLDDPDARVVLTPNSPSEFMARIIKAHFSLKDLSKKYIVPADGSSDVYERFKDAAPSVKQAFIMWEPEVSKALEVPGAHVLLDSSKIKGHIFDVLVVQREFLADFPSTAQKVIEAYLRAAYAYRQSMTELVLKDAKATGSRLTQAQAEKIVRGIRWKNSIENYAHFGLLEKDATKGLDHIEDIIQKITDVLVNTGALDSDPFSGSYHKLFYDKLLSNLKHENFHPGRKVNLLAGDMGLSNDEVIRGTKALAPLTDQEWEQLVPVGRMKINPVSFGRGKSSVGIQSQRDLKKLSEKIKSWPSYYLLVVGHARKEGDPQLNRQLAKERAEVVKMFLIDDCGINANRVRAKAAKVFNRGGSGQSVSFVVGQMPY